VPCYLDTADPVWHEVADRLLELFRRAEGRPRGALEEELEETYGNDPSQLVHQGLAKLLEDRCEFETVSGHPPAELREVVFRTAARHRQSSFDRGAVLREVAGPLGLTAEAVEQGLFADLKSEQRLVRFEDITAERLLHRYNVSLVQAVLLRSVGVEVLVRGEPPQRYRQLLRGVKFRRLVCEMEKTGPDAWRLRLDGPLSLFTATQKYGLQLALFLPAVLQCRDYEVRADLRWGPQRRPKQFTLTARDGLVAPAPDQGMYVPAELGMFAELFRKKIADWELVEETEILPLGDGFWVPDYRLVHRASGRAVYLEVLGFWRRASAERHLERLRRHTDRPFLLAVSEQLRVDDASLEGLPAAIHRFRQMPLADEVARLAAELLPGMAG
jgi:predicted nuclease of restriction endonuclease-like RecB superfamily